MKQQTLVADGPFRQSEWSCQSRITSPAGCHAADRPASAAAWRPCALLLGLAAGRAPCRDRPVPKPDERAGKRQATCARRDNCDTTPKARIGFGPRSPGRTDPSSQSRPSSSFNRTMTSVNSHANRRSIGLPLVATAPRTGSHPRSVSEPSKAAMARATERPARPASPCTAPSIVVALILRFMVRQSHFV